MTTSSRRASFRRAGAAGIVLASLLIAACGGAGGEDCDPEDPTTAECVDDGSDDSNENPTSGDHGNQDGGADGGNDGSDDDADSGGDDSSGDGSGDDADDGGSTGDDSSDGGAGDDADSGDSGGDDSGSGGDDGDDSGQSSATEIPLSELRAHLHNTPADQRPPEFAEWESNMDEYGHNVGQTIQSGSYSSGRPYDVYYDGQYIFMQVAEYLGERQPWVGYAERAGDIYRAYVDRNDGEIPGYWRFSHGFYMDLEDQGDDHAENYLVTMRDEPSFSDPFSKYGAMESAYRSREVAYALQSQIMAAKAGVTYEQRDIDKYVDFALGHVEVWTSGNWNTSNDDWKSWTPFMMGLTASALIDYYEWTVEIGDPDERVLPALEGLADWVWKEFWVDGAHGSEYGAFTYREYADGTVKDPSRDLNLLIAPMYGWLYKETGADRFLNRGDEIFGGGVDLAWLGGGKQFNQNYRESFNYLRWRQEGLDRYGN